MKTLIRIVARAAPVELPGWSSRDPSEHSFDTSVVMRHAASTNKLLNDLFRFQRRSSVIKGDCITEAYVNCEYGSNSNPVDVDLCVSCFICDSLSGVNYWPRYRDSTFPDG